MNKYDKKNVWETVEVVYCRGNVKCHETLQHFFSKRPVYHFHKTLFSNENKAGCLLAFTNL